MPASNGLTARAVITTARVLFIFLLVLLGNRSRYKEGPRAAPRRGRRAPSAAERDHVIVVPVQLLAAGQAPRPAHHHAAGTADPEPGRALPAVDAQLDGARQQAGDDRHDRVAPAALAAARRRRSDPVMAIVSGSAGVAAVRVACRPGWPLPVTGWLWAGSGGRFFLPGGRGGGLAQRWGHRHARGREGTGGPGPVGQGTADAPDVVHDNPLGLMGGAAWQRRAAATVGRGGGGHHAGSPTGQPAEQPTEFWATLSRCWPLAGP